MSDYKEMKSKELNELMETIYRCQRGVHNYTEWGDFGEYEKIEEKMEILDKKLSGELLDHYKTKGVVNNLEEEITRLKSELEKEKEVVDFYANGNNWEGDTSWVLPNDEVFHVLIKGATRKDDCGKHICGKRARQRQEERCKIFNGEYTYPETD